MTDAEERRWRLNVACAHANIVKSDISRALGLSSGAIGQWERRGDGARKNSLRAADIARAITELGGDCPPEALQAGSGYRPRWVEETPC